MILDCSVGQVRVCVFPASWQGATTRQTAFCKEEQRGQGARKTCNRACSVLTQLVKTLTDTMFNMFMELWIQVSGQLGNPG